jgi:prevent-host-death family protein
MISQVSVAQAKRKFSDLVNRVSHFGKRIILTFQGKPRAALISMQDYQRLMNIESRSTKIDQWLKEARHFSSEVVKRHGGPIDVDRILEASREELETKRSTEPID